MKCLTNLEGTKALLFAKRRYKVRRIRWTPGCYWQLDGFEDDGGAYEPEFSFYGTAIFKHDCAVFPGWVAGQWLHNDWEAYLPTQEVPGMQSQAIENNA